MNFSHYTVITAAGLLAMACFIPFASSALLAETATKSPASAVSVNERYGPLPKKLDRADDNLIIQANALPPWLYFAGLTVTCKITPENGTFIGRQTAPVGDDASILSVRLKNCRYEVEGDGSGQLIADLEVDLSETANLEACNAISLAFLFDVTSLSEEFSWAGHKTLVDSLEVRSVYGDVREIAFFELHDSRTGSVSMQALLEESGNFPGYVDLFWGRVVLLTSTGNDIQSLMEDRLRKLESMQSLDQNGSAGPVEFQIDLGVRMYPPRGACADYPAANDAPVVQHPIIFQ